MTETYQGWWDVPAHLLTKTALGELEFPRTCEGRKPDAFVEARDWRDRRALFALFDVRACPPTAASAAQLDAAQRRRMKTRACQDCGARCQQPLTTVGEDPLPARLCPACRHIALLRREQTRFAGHRSRTASDVAAVLAGPPAVLLQLDLHEPPRTERGSRRPVPPTGSRCFCDASPPPTRPAGRTIDADQPAPQVPVVVPARTR